VEILVNKEEYEAQKTEILSLKFRLAQLEKMLFGRKSEKYLLLKDPQQLSLLPAEAVEQIVEAEVVKTIVTKKVIKPRPNHPGKNQFPAHLPVDTIILEPNEDTSGMKYIGDEVTETLDYSPGVLKIRRVIRRKYVEQTSDPLSPTQRIHIAALPVRPIPKGIPEAGLLAHIFVCKYIDHLPFYRTIQRFKRDYDWEPSRATMSGWFNECCRLMHPLYKLLKQKILSADYLMVDETRYKVLEDGKPGKCFMGWFWLYEDPKTKLVIYNYRKDRSADSPLAMLAGFVGHIQVDGYTSYPVVERKLAIILLMCWAHARRKFIEAYEYDKQGVDEVLQLIRELYAVEDQLRQLNATHAKRYEVRQQKSKPLLDKIALWMKDNAAKYPPSSPVSKAIQYTASRWEELNVYITDGKFEIDNNLVENSVRPVALGRKNYLFAGSHEAAEHAAMMYSFFTSCRRNNVNPFEWLKDVLERIPEHSIQRLEELLPDQWVKGGW
jgi:transposase